MAEKTPLIVAVAYVLLICGFAFLAIHFGDRWGTRLNEWLDRRSKP